MSVTYCFRVGFADVDYARIVFFGSHYLWMDRAFEARLLEVGISYKELLDERRIALPIVESHCVYRAPLGYGDEVEVPLRIREFTARGMDIGFQTVRLSDGRVAAEGWTRRRFIDLDQFRGTSLPPDLFERFAAISDDPTWREE